MAGRLTIDRSWLGLGDLVIANDPDDGVTLDPDFSMGVIAWRKNTDMQPNVPGRTLGDFTRETMTALGGITCYGSTPTELQTQIGVVIQALTQVDADNGFPDNGFLMTYSHIDGSDTADYSWYCTEPGDCNLGGSPDGTLADDRMANLLQAVSFSIVRNPIPVSGPV